jgi:hypothetical protein
MAEVRHSGWPAEAEFAGPGKVFSYLVYGVRVDSDVRLSLNEVPSFAPPDGRLLRMNIGFGERPDAEAARGFEHDAENSALRET